MSIYTDCKNALKDIQFAYETNVRLNTEIDAYKKTKYQERLVSILELTNDLKTVAAKFPTLKLLYIYPEESHFFELAAMLEHTLGRKFFRDGYTIDPPAFTPFDKKSSYLNMKDVSDQDLEGFRKNAYLNYALNEIWSAPSESKKAECIEFVSKEMEEINKLIPTLPRDLLRDAMEQTMRRIEKMKNKYPSFFTI